MKLITDIPEDVYTRLFDNGIQDNEIAVDDICEMARALRLGTPLPKGHGKIIDVNEAINYIDDYAFGFFSFDDVPAIIEADTESEEVNEKETC